MLGKYAQTLVFLFALIFSGAAHAQDYTVTDIDDLIKKLGDLHKGSEIIQEGVTVLTRDGGFYNFIPEGTVSQYIARIAPNCGGSHPVIFVQPAGGFEYRWCVHAAGTSAWMDGYQFVSGSLNLRSSVSVNCTPGMPGPVWATVGCH